MACYDKNEREFIMTHFIIGILVIAIFFTTLASWLIAGAEGLALLAITLMFTGLIYGK